MTDDPVHTALSDDYLRYQRAARERTQREAALRPANKAAVFEALAADGVVRVEATFDGQGDSGQIESIDAWDGRGEVAMPARTVLFAQMAFGGTEVETMPVPIKEAIEALAYDLLRLEHAGWEINEGAFGEFVFEVAARTVRLDYNERVLETQFTQSEF